ncbi:MAG: DUF5132 domain-containing protein [Methylocystis sp.]
MSKSKVEADEQAHAHAVVENEHDADDELSEEESNIVATVATVGVVGIGVAVFEAALLPGLALGVVAMAVPKFAPKLGAALSPMFKSTVRGVYKLGQKTKELVAETNEHVQDIVAEVDAEAKGKPAPAKDAASAA